LGNVRTPYFIAIKIRDNGTHAVIHSESSGFKDVQTFLESMIAASGLKVDGFPRWPLKEMIKRD
jgi:hypothetical protein